MKIMTYGTYLGRCLLAYPSFIYKSSSLLTRSNIEVLRNRNTASNVFCLRLHKLVLRFSMNCHFDDKD